MRVHQVHDEEERLPTRIVHQLEGTAHYVGGWPVHADRRRVFDVVHVKPAGHAIGRVEKPVGDGGHGEDALLLQVLRHHRDVLERGQLRGAPVRGPRSIASALVDEGPAPGVDGGETGQRPGRRRTRRARTRAPRPPTHPASGTSADHSRTSPDGQRGVCRRRPELPSRSVGRRRTSRAAVRHRGRTRADVYRFWKTTRYHES